VFNKFKYRELQVPLFAENRLFRWSRVCLIFQNQTEIFLLYTLTIDAAQSAGYTMYVERNLLPNLRLKRTPIYKVFPHINVSCFKIGNGDTS
jgi:hypothetical protein